MFGEPRNPVEKEIFDFEKEIQEIRKKMADLRQKLPEEKVQNYEFTNFDGSKTKFIDLISLKR